MIVRMMSAALLALILVASSGQTARAQAEPPMTLWRFLGIPQGYEKAHGKLFNKRGNRPGLERKPPLLPLADLANLESGIPALETAAEIKIAEDLAPQKIKAIKYLASIGCGCYDKDGKITAALLAAMAEDCTETVRLAAVQAISTAAQGEVCEQCNLQCCCDKLIVEQLAIIAYERDEFGCWVEPSERVRQAAIEALAVCCPGPPPPVTVLPTPTEPPPVEPPPIEPLQPDVIEPLDEPEMFEGLEADDAPASSTPLTMLRVRAGSHHQGNIRPVSTASSGPHNSGPHNPVQPTPDGPVLTHVRGVVDHVNFSTGYVQVGLHGQRVPSVGTQLGIYQRFARGVELVAELEVLEATAEQALTRVVDRKTLPKITRGAQVIGWNRADTH